MKTVIKMINKHLILKIINKKIVNRINNNKYKTKIYNKAKNLMKVFLFRILRNQNKKMMIKIKINTL